MNMNEKTKRIVVSRIISHLNPVPANAENELLQQTLPDLEVILDKLATTREQENVEETAYAHIEEMRRASKADGAWAHALCNVWLNGKRLVDAQANRDMLEGLLQPHEEPTAAIYGTLALQYPQKLTWEAPRTVKTDADRQAEFEKICRENLLSECEANRQLHKDGVAQDAWAGASGIERTRFHTEAAQARQQWLVHHATPSELKAEAAYQSQTERDIAVKAEVDRQRQYVLSQQGHYPQLPATNESGEVLDARYLRKISTINFPLFKQLVKKHGSGNVTSRLRGDN
jgi:hypothetical protein